MSNVEEFFKFCRERHSIYVKREQLGAKAPWTKDLILREYRFCNIYRELDTTTAWFRDNIRNPLRDRHEVLLATFVFRFFNKISIGEVLKDRAIGLWEEGLWDSRQAEQRIRHEYPNGPWVTGAYMVKTPPGMDKLKGVLWAIDQFAPHAPGLAAEAESREFTLQELHSRLKEFPYIGAFMAYELVTDLRHTYLGRNAEDINSWASLGPGAARGLSRIFHQGPGHWSYGNPTHQRLMMEELAGLLSKSRKPEHWPSQWTAWEAREVEHALCEFDKYERVRLGEGRPKQVFRKGGA